MMYIQTLLIWLACCLWLASASDNGVARTPPMGWNSWNHFACNLNELNETLFMQMADVMVKSGMKDAGYEYINLDDCWLAKTRDAQGRLQPDPVRFPHGIKALADYVHSLDLKFGIYEDTATKTCEGYPGSEGYYAVDAATYLEWGVDYVKLDGCYTNVSDMHAIYTLNSELFNATGRPMVFSCSWPTYAYYQGIPVNFTYVASICNLWREYDDVSDSWESWTGILDFQAKANLSQYAGPGNWNDPDMLEVGNGNQTNIEYQSLFSLWSILAAPLIAGNDLRNMDNETLAILTAPEVIAVDQDPLGKEGRRVVQDGQLEVWVRELSGNTLAVALFNRSPETAAITADWADIGLESGVSADVRDLWARSDLGSFTGSYSAKVVSHGTVLVKITPKS
eukprot:Phypoly_transcript_08795.p1 GENE.Phypoly_transcript_08795~~Phypoly_transcript_08795.p1  ORF type:complete len:395 (+),score=34.18 Phypoly_transcript_08795:71-1255(+)